MDLPPLPGDYALLLRLSQELALSVRSLGEFRLQPGEYLYLGSARGPGGLRGRLNRHLERIAGHKLHPPHWHIDHLLAAATVQAFFYALAEPADPRRECLWSQSAGQLPGALFPIPRFGASDCRSGCRAHLVSLGHEPPSADALAAHLESSAGCPVFCCRMR